MPRNLTQVAGSYVGTLEEQEQRRASTAGHIHILDHQTDQIVDFYSNKKKLFWDDVHFSSLENYEEYFNFVTLYDNSEYIQQRNRVIIPDEDGFFREFIITETLKNGDFKEVYTLASFVDDLKKSKTIKPQTFDGVTINAFLDDVLSGTGWQRGITDYLGIRTITIENVTYPFSVLKTGATTFEGELRFRIETDGNKITGRYVDLIERQGSWNGKEITVGKDLIGVKRRETSDNIVTALMCLGPEREDGTRLEVTVEDDDARIRWGRPDASGEPQHLWGVYEPASDDQDMTEDRLRSLGETELEKRINSVVEYEADQVSIEHVFGFDHEKVRKGDTVRIKDTSYTPALYLEARVKSVERSISDSSVKKYYLGDFIEYEEEDLLALFRSMQKVLSQKISEQQLRERTYTKGEIDTKDQTVYDNSKSYTDTETVPGKEAKQKIDQDVGSGTIETTDGSQNKADDARDQANDYTDQTIVPINTRLTDAENAISQAESDLAQAEQDIINAQNVLSSVTTEYEGQTALYGKVVTNELISENAIITGTFAGVNAVFDNITVQNAVITGELQGVTGTFLGDIEGAVITGSSFESKSDVDATGWSEMFLTSGEIIFERRGADTILKGTTRLTAEGIFYEGSLEYPELIIDTAATKFLGSVDTGDINLNGVLRLNDGDDPYLFINKDPTANKFEVSWAGTGFNSYTLSIGREGAEVDFPGLISSGASFDQLVRFIGSANTQGLARMEFWNADESTRWGRVGYLDSNDDILGIQNYMGEVRIYATDLTATGSKSAVVETDSFGTRKLYAVESTAVWFETTIEAELGAGEHWIDIDPMFLETITGKYFVKIYPQGEGRVYPVAFEDDRFKVKVDTVGEIPFVIVISGKRKGYEDIYMEEAPSTIFEGEDMVEH